MRALRSAGWTLERIQGSHYVMRAPDGRVVSIPVHGAKTLPVGTIKGIIDRLGVTVEEFIQLL